MSSSELMEDWLETCDELRLDDDLDEGGVLGAEEDTEDAILDKDELVTELCDVRLDWLRTIEDAEDMGVLETTEDEALLLGAAGAGVLVSGAASPPPQLANRRIRLISEARTLMPWGYEQTEEPSFFLLFRVTPTFSTLRTDCLVEIEGTRLAWRYHAIRARGRRVREIGFFFVPTSVKRQNERDFAENFTFEPWANDVAQGSSEYWRGNRWMYLEISRFGTLYSPGTSSIQFFPGRHRIFHSGKRRC